MTKNWKSLVVLSLVAISANAARAGDDEKNWVQESPGMTGAGVAAASAFGFQVANWRGEKKLDRTPMPGYSNGDMDRVGSDAGQRFRDENEKAARQRAQLYTKLHEEEAKYKVLLERPTSHATQEETIAVSHAQEATVRPGFFHPHVTEHVSDAASDVVTTTNGVSRSAIEQHKKIEEIKFKLAELDTKISVNNMKQTEAKFYLSSGSHGNYLTSKDRKYLDSFKPRYEVARVEAANLSKAYSEKEAKKELLGKVTTRASLASFFIWPATIAGVEYYDERQEQERREKAYKEQEAAAAPAAAAAQTSGSEAK